MKNALQDGGGRSDSRSDTDIRRLPIPGDEPGGGRVTAPGTTGRIVCRLCGSDNLVFVFRESDGSKFHECWRCSTCRLLQTVGQIAPFSPDYVDLAPEDLSDGHRFLQTRGKASAFSQWQTLLAAHGRQEGRLLDIGCGVGGFLDFAAAGGFEVYGYDASTAQAENARQRHPRVCTATTIAAYESALGSALPAFDVVSMWDVFEHVRQPRLLLREIRERMAPTGFLFLSVPGGGPIPAKVALARLRGRPPGLIPWEHVFYYEPSSLQRLLRESGFTVVETGGVAAYVREPGFAESVRRSIHRSLAKTRFALQLFVLARPLR